MLSGRNLKAWVLRIHEPVDIWCGYGSSLARVYLQSFLHGLSSVSATACCICSPNTRFCYWINKRLRDGKPTIGSLGLRENTRALNKRLVSLVPGRISHTPSGPWFWIGRNNRHALSEVTHHVLHLGASHMGLKHVHACFRDHRQNRRPT